MGTADAICSMLGKINEPFIMVNGDDIYGKEVFIEGSRKFNDKNIIGVLKIIDTMPTTGFVNRGVVTITDERVTDMKEYFNISIDDKKMMDQMANINFIGITLSTLNFINDHLVKFKELHKDNPTIESILTDILGFLIKNGTIEMDYFIIKNKVIGITNANDEIFIRELFNEKKLL